MKKAKVLRVAIPAAVLVAVAVGFACSQQVGTLCAVGWEDISILCPLGALTSMLASKTLIPRAVLSLIVALVVIVLVGRAFCAWVCPVPLVSRLRHAFSRKPKAAGEGAGAGEEGSACEAARAAAEQPSEGVRACSSCGACGKAVGSLTRQDGTGSRYLVLGGALLTATVFGFPVFCLICPIGLTFAAVTVVFLLFTQGDVTWSAVIIPALLLVEVVFFRKWCSHICPLAALMGLVSKLNRTWRPKVDHSICLEAKGARCHKCAQSCAEGIDLTDLAAGAPLSDCTKCRACLDACPAHAISMPLLPSKAK